MIGFIHWFERHTKISWLITILIGIFIFYVSSLSLANLSVTKGLAWKSVIYHISVFFLFEFFIAISIVKGKKIKLIFLSIFISIIYGISDEIHQFFVPNRVCSFSDVMLDTIGILSAGFIYMIILYKQKKTNDFKEIKEIVKQ